MPEKQYKTLDDILRVFHLSQELQKIDFQTRPDFFNPMDINKQMMPLFVKNYTFFTVLNDDFLNDLIKWIRSSSGISQPKHFHKIEVTSTFSASKDTRKITKMLQSLGCQSEVDSCQSIKTLG